MSDISPQQGKIAVEVDARAAAGQVSARPASLCQEAHREVPNSSCHESAWHAHWDQWGPWDRLSLLRNLALHQDASESPEQAKEQIQDFNRSERSSEGAWLLAVEARGITRRPRGERRPAQDWQPWVGDAKTDPYLKSLFFFFRGMA